jgi:heme/copper-type cytochrome/quinol oxidase subunit 3
MNTNRKNVILALLVALALGAAFVSASVTSQAQNTPPAQDK